MTSASASFHRLRGTKDLFGSEASAWDELERRAAEVFARFGFDGVRIPVMEEAALFKRSVGEVTDIVQKEMYAFEDRSGTAVALRPEGTAGIVRAYIENNWGADGGVGRFWYSGPMFRAERPQAGRLRQFHQIGGEVFGSRSPMADAETIEVLARILEAVGITDYRVEMNNLGDPADRAKYTEALNQYLEPHVTKMPTEHQDRIRKNPMRFLDSKDPAVAPVIEQAPCISEFLSTESREHFAQVRELIKASGISAEVNERIVRGLDYYTHTVFEFKHPQLGAQDALAAGGRYDGLVQTLGGNAVPAVGFALGVERLMMIAEKKGIALAVPVSRPAFFIGMDAQSRKDVYAWASSLRGRGRRACVDFEERSLKASLRQANRIQSRCAIILGSQERERGVATVKDLERGEQQEIPAADVVNYVEKLLS